MIWITQKCDRCGRERDLNVGFHGGRQTIAKAADVGGWREVSVNRHLCNKCISAAINPSED